MKSKIISSATKGQNLSYSKNDNRVTYQLTVENKKGAGFGRDLKLKDSLKTINAELLHSASNKTKNKPVFSAWEVTSKIEIINTLGLTLKQQNSIKSATKIGTLTKNNNIDLTLQLPPNVRVIYRIDAHIDRSTSKSIRWGKFTNTATLSTPIQKNNKTVSSTIIPKIPHIRVKKEADSQHFEIGKQITFNIHISNDGNGYANDVEVTDLINEQDIFEPGWSIKPNTDTNSKTGSNSDTLASLTAGNDIKTLIDIDPKGWVDYQITATVKASSTQENLTNTVNIFDPINKTHYSSSASLTKDTNSNKLNISITKNADNIRMVPGKFLTYTITLLNNSDSETEDKLILTDNLTLTENGTAATGILANAKNDHFTNLMQQSPFDYWQLGSGSPITYGKQQTGDFKSAVFSLSHNEKKTFQIKVHIKNNFIGVSKDGALSKIIANRAVIEKAGSKQSQSALHEIRLADASLFVHRTLLVNTKASDTYKPGDTLTYQIKYSSANAYSNDINIHEDILGVRVLAMDGKKYQPFNNKFTIEATKIDSNGGAGTTDGKDDGTVANNKNINTTIDIAPNDSVSYDITGIVRSDAVGDITFGGITLKPVAPHLVFLKTTKEKNYQPNQPLHYILTIKNTGKGNADNIPIIDTISKVNVTGIGEPQKNIVAFEPGWVITAKITEENSDTNKHSSAGTFNNGEDLNTTFSLRAGSTLTYYIKTTVNPKAIGNIINKLSVDGNTVSNISKADTQRFTYEKKISAYYDTNATTKLKSELSGYKPGGYIEYQIKLHNQQNVHLSNISIKDEISKVMSSCYLLSTGEIKPCPAFDHWSISVKNDSSGITNAGKFLANTDLNTYFDLAAKDNSFIIYTIKAHIKENVVGSFSNQVSINQHSISRSATSKMLAPKIEIQHKTYTDNTLTTEKKRYQHTPAEQNVVYHLHIKNTGNGLEYAKKLKEMFSQIYIKLAQITQGQTDKYRAPVYKNWTLSVSKSDGKMTSINGFKSGENKDINIPYLSIAPGGWIDFVMQASIREDAIGKIEITPTYTGEKIAKSTIKQIDRNLTITKKIVSIGDRSYSSSNNQYYPGETVKYRVVIKNTKAIWYNNALIKDLLSAVKVDIIGQKSASAFRKISITSTVTGSISDKLERLIYDPSTDLDIEASAGVDIAPLQTLTFNIDALIREDALGVIMPNIAETGSIALRNALEKAKSPQIRPFTSALSFEKTLISSIADNNSTCTEPSTTGENCFYSPEGQVIYQIKVTNDGKSIANNVHITDFISKIKTSDKSRAFSSSNVEVTKKPLSSDFSIRGDYQGPKDLNAHFDLMGGKSVTFEVIAKVDAIATGTIENIASINNTPTNAILLNQGTAIIKASKRASIKTYKPGDDIIYTLDITNTSGINADVLIIDKISEFKVETADGDKKTALSTWTIQSKIMSDGATNSTKSYTDISKLPISGDINSTIQMAAAQKNKQTHVRITIKGKIRKDALGTFTNTAIINGQDYRLEVGHIRPIAGQLKVSKATTKGTIYLPGKAIGFDITVSNSGQGYLKNVIISDLLSDIHSDFAGQILPGQVFEKWDNVIVDIKDTAPKLSFVVNTLNDSNGYISTYNIAPLDTIKIHLEGTVNAKTMGDITNTVRFTDAQNIKKQASATYTPTPGDLTLSYSVDKAQYKNNDRLTYLITIQNTTHAWVKNVHITDLFTQLQADNIYGITSNAFDPDSLNITFKSFKKRTKLPTVSKDLKKRRTNINHILDIAPNDIITISASITLLDKINGEIDSQVKITFNKKELTVHARSSSSLANLIFTKTAPKPIYTQNNDAQFILKIENNSKNYAQKINLADLISKLTVKTRNGAMRPAFNKWQINVIVKNNTTTSVEKKVLFRPFDLNNNDINTRISLPPQTSITFTLTGTVNKNAIGVISNDADMDFNGKTTTKTAKIKPATILLSVTKNADKSEYNNTDTQITYTLEAYNRGSSDISNVVLSDKISQLKTVTGTSLFTDWVTLIKEMPSGKIIATQNNVDLHATQTLKAYAANAFLITVTGSINKGLNDDITNTFDATTPSGETAKASVSVHVKKYADNEGQLLVTKRALKDTMQVGEVVEYEVIVENHNESEFRDVVLEDRYPAGFQYVPDSTQITHSGKDGRFDTPDDILSYIDPSLTHVLHFNIGDLFINTIGTHSVHEKVRIRYLLRASVGTTFGKYINTAYARALVNSHSSRILTTVSNLSSASVEITPDKLFDTASIIGKVFEDQNQDGYQADATATNIIVHVDLAPDVYIKGSTTLSFDNKEISQTDIINDIHIARLMGLSRNRTLTQNNKVILQFSTLTPDT